jgi:hypothetical protein
MLALASKAEKGRFELRVRFCVRKTAAGSDDYYTARRSGAGRTHLFGSAHKARRIVARKRSPHMVNIPRALFTGRTGREPRYHVAIEELQDWTYTGNRLLPLKGYPGIVWERPKSRRRPRDAEVAEFLERHLSQ